MVAKQPFDMGILLLSFITNHSHTCHGCKATNDMGNLFTKLYHQSFPHLSWLQSNHWHENSFYKALSPIIPTPVMVAKQPLTWEFFLQSFITNHSHTCHGCPATMTGMWKSITNPSPIIPTAVRKLIHPTSAAKENCFAPLFHPIPFPFWEGQIHI